MKSFRSKFFQLLTLIYQRELQIIREADLTLLEYYTLQILNFSQGTAPKDLAKNLALAKSTVTYLVDSLEARKLVRREQVKSDRRSYLVSLTEKGRVEVGKLFDRKSQLLLSSLVELSPEERAAIERLIESILQEAGGSQRKGVNDDNDKPAPHR